MENHSFVYLFALVMILALNINKIDSFETNRVKRHDYVRCKLFDGVGCRWYCRALTGQSGGSCDENGDCNCSEEKLEKYVCGGDEVADNTGDALCAGWCQAKGRQTGDCNFDKKECECSTAKLEKGHVKCVNDMVCDFYCQIKENKARGECTGPHGWDCVCVSKDENNVEVDGGDQ